MKSPQLLPLDKLISEYRELSYKKGEFLLRPYDELHSVFVIKSGYVQSHAISEEGTEFSINIFRSGSVLPLALALEGGENLYSYTALCRVKAVKIPIAKIRQLFKDHPDLTFHFLENFASALNRISMRMESIVFGTAAQKVASALLLVHLRFGDQIKKEKRLAFILTHRQIAVMTGLTRETVSAEMIKLKRADVIYYEAGKVSILKPEELQSLSSISHYFGD